jgi:hypothetical protein
VANQCNVIILEEAAASRPDGWTLCYQWCRYEYADGSKEFGYRFIWRWPTGKLQAARGQARIPSAAIIKKLLAHADAQGWGDKSSPDAGEFE